MRCAVTRTASWAIVCFLIFPLIAAAQSPQGIGRAGYGWQTDQALESERMKQFLVELEPLSLDEWKEKALAWLELRPESENGGVTVPLSLHIDSLEVRKADVAAIDEAGSWTIVPAKKKLPRKMSVVLTDPDRTKVECPLPAVANGGEVVGIFLYEGVLHCLVRGQG